MRAVLPLIVSGLMAASCGSPSGETSPSSQTGVPQQLRVEVLEVRPHDRSSFTQGFELVDGVLYEGTGLVGSSAMLATDPATGEVSQRIPLAAPLFGEGITVVGDRVWQLTWQNGIAVERDRRTLAELRRVEYSGEGWGLCHDGQRLVMSDGSDRLTFRDPVSFTVTGEVRVPPPPGLPVGQLNELECADGSVWANVWRTDHILRIDPGSGQVTAVVDAAGLLAEHGDPTAGTGADVLNGIAALPEGEFLITGKLWPHTFRVRFVPA